MNGGSLPEIKFFHVGRLKIGEYDTTILNQRMSGLPGLEFFGPYADLEGVRATLLEAGEEYGITRIGGRAYASVAGESGWIANTVPAIATYSSEETKSFREWLPARSFEAHLALGGSFISDRLEDYYVTPWEIGYTHITKFNHDFIGRDALERRASEKHRIRMGSHRQRRKTRRNLDAGELLIQCAWLDFARHDRRRRAQLRRQG